MTKRFVAMNNYPIKNAIAFLFILFNEDPVMFDRIRDMSPSYIMEKWDRYMNYEGDYWRHGMHPLLREQFDMYCEVWEMENDG